MTHWPAVPPGSCQHVWGPRTSPPAAPSQQLHAAAPLGRQSHQAAPTDPAEDTAAATATLRGTESKTRAVMFRSSIQRPPTQESTAPAAA